MKQIRSGVWLRCVALLIGTVSLGAAQTRPHAPAPSARTLVLPDKLVAGSPGTLAVLDAAGRLMPGVTVELSGRPTVTTDATGRASFLSPPGPGVLVAWTANRAVTATAAIEPASSEAPGSATPAPEGPGAVPAGVAIASFPQFISPYDQFTITGSGFNGIADANRVFVADQPCLVLAASPVALTVLPGTRIPIGAAVLRVSGAPKNGAAQQPETEADKPVAVISLEVTGPTRNIHAGAQGTLTIQAHGTAERVQVELRNSSPTIVQLIGGNMQRIVTSGGDPNTAQVPLKFLASGDYTITAHLLPGGSVPASGT